MAGPSQQDWTDGNKLDAADFNLAMSLGTYEFGGDGSDGDVTIGADTQIDTSSGIVVKQYNSLTISAGFKLHKTQDENPLIVLVKGNCTINGDIDMDAEGCDGATKTDAETERHDGSSGAWGLPQGGVGSRGWVSSSTSRSHHGGGGGGGAYCGMDGELATATDSLLLDLPDNDTADGSAGSSARLSLGYGRGTGGAGWYAQVCALANISTPRELLIPPCGAGGGAGGGTGATTEGGAGGIGGGSCYLEVYGDLTFGAASVFTFDGVAGSAGEIDTHRAGGGGGGGGGSFIVKCNGSFTDSGATYTNTGGAGGSATVPGGYGGAGGAGIYKIIEA